MRWLTNESLQKEDIEFAIVSAYCWNFAWMYQMFDRKTAVIAVDHSQTGESSSFRWLSRVVC